MQVKEIVVAATDVNAKEIVHDTGESAHTLYWATAGLHLVRIGHPVIFYTSAEVECPACPDAPTRGLTWSPRTDAAFSSPSTEAQPANSGLEIAVLGAASGSRGRGLL